MSWSQDPQTRMTPKTKRHATATTLESLESADGRLTLSSILNGCTGLVSHLPTTPHRDQTGGTVPVRSLCGYLVGSIMLVSFQTAPPCNLALVASRSRP